MSESHVKIRLKHKSGNQGLTWFSVAMSQDEWNEMGEDEREEWVEDCIYEFTVTEHTFVKENI